MTEREADACAGINHGDWSPRSPLEYGELAAFARAYPDLIRLWGRIGPAKVRIMSTLSRPELDAVAREGDLVRLPGDRKPRALLEMGEEELFAYVCLAPPAGAFAEERRRRYERRLEALQALYDEARGHAYPLPEDDEGDEGDDFEARWGYAAWALDAARERLPGVR